jgi:hypothetical protein
LTSRRCRPPRDGALAVHAKQGHIEGMARPRPPQVIFKMQRIAEDNWQIAADYPGAETRYIKGLKSKADVDDWLAGSRRIDWLRSQGYAK